MWGNQQYFATEVKFPPSKATLALWYKPNLILPLSGTVFSFNNITKLIWDSLSLMTGYHVQVSTDSLFKTITIDTTISSLNMSLPVLKGLTQYFWRVAGINSEGESRWSDVWNFTTGINADVQSAQSSTFSLAVYPNPAADKLNISYSSPNGDVNLSLYDLLGNKVLTVSQESDATGKVELSLAGLPNGEYFLELKSGGLHKSMPISVLR